MSSTIDTLKSSIRGGGGLARSNKWSVDIAKRISGIKAFEGVDGIVLAESVTLPGRTLGTSEYTTNRETLKTVYTFIDDPVTITFLLTNDYQTKKFFDAWMTEIIDPDTYRLGYKDTYASTVNIHQLDTTNKKIYNVTLEKAYPIVQSSIELSNVTENDITRLTVTFAYDRYIIDKSVDK